MSFVVTAIVGASIAAAGVGYTIAAGEDAKRKQADALGKQERAQQQAVNAAQGQRKQSEMVVNKANRQQPDVAGIMQAASARSSDGPSGTMLTGPTGVDPNSLALGKSSLLGS
jgi:type II secretory pathway pseudopilin PulG